MDRQILSAEEPVTDSGSHKKISIEEIYHNYGRFIFRVALRLTRSRPRAEDLFQETLYRAQRSLNSYEPRGKIMAWLARITVNIFLDEERKLGRVSLSDDMETVQALSPFTEPAVDPLARVQQRQFLQRLEQLLEELPPRQRTVVVLHDIEEFDSSEIAEMLNITAAGVRSNLHLAREKLRAALKPYVDGEE